MCCTLYFSSNAAPNTYPFLSNTNVERFIINCFIGGVLSIIVAFSIPKQYTSTVVLAPEFSSGASLSSGGIGALASMAGLNLGGLSGSEDALYPELYPQVVSSTPFLCVP